MKILKYLLFLFLIAIIGFSVYVTTQPDEYRVERSRLINAPLSMVYDHINDYRKWPHWSPWMEKEKDAVLNFSDPSYGEEATYSWKGDELGEGSMTTMYSAKDSILQKINFIKPYESEADVFWNLEKTKTGIQVSWGMEGKLGFMEKAYLVFQGNSMEAIIAPDYERGLLNLDHYLHEEMAKYSIEFPGVTQYGGGYSVYQTTAFRISEADDQIAKMTEEVSSYLERENIGAAGPPFAVIEKWDRENDAALIALHIPVRDQLTMPSGSTVFSGYTPPGEFYKAVLTGDHKNLKEVYEKTYFNLEKLDYIVPEDRSGFEVFVKGPKETENPAEWVTEVYIPFAKKDPSN